MRNYLTVCALLLSASGCFAAASKDVPSWVQEVSSTSLPPYSGKVPAAVLIEEQRVTMDSLVLQLQLTQPDRLRRW
jgi:Tfp pilus assembly protein PilP